MARIIYNAAVSEINGSVSGSTFQKNAFGYTIRKKPQPVNHRSNLQANRRTVFADITKTWNLLTDAQRAQWNAVISTYPSYAAHAPGVVISGRMLFIKYNAIRQAAGYDILIDFDITTPTMFTQNITLINEANDLQVVWSDSWADKDIGCTLQLSSNQGTTPWKKPTVFRQMNLEERDSTHYSVSSSYINAYGKLAQTENWLGVYSVMYSLTQPYFYAIKSDFIQVGGTIPIRSTFTITTVTGVPSLTGDVIASKGPDSTIAISSVGQNKYNIYDSSGDSWSTPINAPEGGNIAGICQGSDGSAICSITDNAKIYKYNYSLEQWDEMFDSADSERWSRIKMLDGGYLIAYSSISNQFIISTNDGCSWNNSSTLSLSGITLVNWCYSNLGQVALITANHHLLIYNVNTDEITHNVLANVFGNPEGLGLDIAGFVNYITYPDHNVVKFDQSTEEQILVKTLEIEDHIFNMVPINNSIITATSNSDSTLQAIDSDNNLSELTSVTDNISGYPFLFLDLDGNGILLSRSNLTIKKISLSLP